MAKLFNNTYRIASSRLQTWDYGSDGAYFITICTQGRIHHFGNIQNQEMHLSDIGVLAYQFWLEIPTRFPYVHLDAFIVMPNHIHGILIVDKSNFMDKSGDSTQLTQSGDSTQLTQSGDSTHVEINRVSTPPTQPKPPTQRQSKQRHKKNRGYYRYP